MHTHSAVLEGPSLFTHDLTQLVNIRNWITENMINILILHVPIALNPQSVKSLRTIPHHINWPLPMRCDAVVCSNNCLFT